MTAISENKRWLLHMGAGAHRAIVERGMDRNAALEYIAQVALEAGNEQSFVALTPSFALAWAECGFPVVEPAHRLAASMMATSMPKDLVDEFARMPWRCFLIQVHPGLVGDEGALMWALQSREDNRIRALTFIGTHMHLGDESTISDWNAKIAGDLTVNGKAIDVLHPQYESADRSFRKTELLGRLFVSVCAELSSRNESIPRADTPTGRKRNSDEPRCVTYKLTRNVRVDARSAIREYAEGSAKLPPSVQIMVRGHWKLQAHGPALSERKLIHVEPYWRGPDDAPIGVRTHPLKGDS